jgi:hypothetical protein
VHLVEERSRVAGANGLGPEITFRFFTVWGVAVATAGKAVTAMTMRARTSSDGISTCGRIVRS